VRHDQINRVGHAANQIGRDAAFVVRGAHGVYIRRCGGQAGTIHAVTNGRRCG
jgi:hypothetical protein